MRETPETLVEQVVDEASFLRFLAALRDDWADERARERAHPSPPYGSGANGWENGTIGDFLDAAVHWAQADKAHWAEQENSWRRAADILLAGKFYE
jgi:hypothetical protein